MIDERTRALLINGELPADLGQGIVHSPRPVPARIAADPFPDDGGRRGELDDGDDLDETVHLPGLTGVAGKAVQDHKILRAGRALAEKFGEDPGGDGKMAVLEEGPGRE